MRTTVDLELGDRRPDLDPIAIACARSRVEQAMFGRTEPARLGRYQIVERVAIGGMGQIYAAYDPDLDRKVALKVLHPGQPDASAHRRLIQEGRALARLDHRNVVTVHDVLTREGQIVVVMELVAGETLAAWDQAAPRSWREVVATYAQAGDGLAAAHSVHVVHRDFKPSNAIVRGDGRVAVLDFGLARFAGEPVEAAAGDPTGGSAPRPAGKAVGVPTPRLATLDPTGGSAPRPAGKAVGVPTPRLATLDPDRAIPRGVQTLSGVFLGTPAYAAPEQLAGGVATAASDQFSFCVALHRAVEGVAPFHGRTPDELVAGIRSGAPQLARDGRSVPGWLRSALRRGLAAEPAQRHASMAVLLAELRRVRGWRRWRRAVVAGALVAAAVAITAALAGGATPPTCDGGAPELAAVWDAARRDAIDARLRSIARPYAAEVRSRVLDGLAGYAQGWSAVHRGACVAHRRGAESDALFDHQVGCLRRRLGDLDAAVAVLVQTGAGTLTHAVDVVVGMASPTECADTARVAADVDPPATPAQHDAVAAARDRIRMAAALDRGARAEQAMSAARDAVAAARSSGYLPVIAEAELAQGRILLSQREVAAAAPLLRDALTTALSLGSVRVAVEAGARAIYAEGVERPDLARLEHDVQYLEAMSRALAGDHFVRPLLFSNAAVVYTAAGRRDDARRYAQRAHDELGGGPPAIELNAIDQNLALLTPDPELRMRLARDAWSRLRTTLGEHHVLTLDAALVGAHFQIDPAAAYDQLTALCGAYRPLIAAYLECETARGVLAQRLGKLDAARAAYAAIVDAAGAHPDPDQAIAQQLAAGELAVLRGAPRDAIAPFRAVIAARGASADWWMRAPALQAELGTARAAIADGSPAAARPHLETAERGYAEITQINPSIVYRLELDAARSALGSTREDSPERSPHARH